MSEARIEAESLRDLSKIVRRTREWGTSVAVIGGYAVRAYTRGYRSTKDIDLVVLKEGLGTLREALNRLGYGCRDTEFGIAGSRRFNEGHIDVHVSVGRILDISTGLSYPVDRQLFEKTNELPVKSYYEGVEVVSAPVVDLETLVLLKLIPVGRENDAVDVMSLLIDRREEVDPEKLAAECAQAGLEKHIISRLRSYANDIRRRNMDRLWFRETGQRLSHADRQRVLRFIRDLVNLLRK